MKGIEKMVQWAENKLKGLDDGIDLSSDRFSKELRHNFQTESFEICLAVARAYAAEEQAQKPDEIGREPGVKKEEIK